MASQSSDGTKQGDAALPPSYAQTMVTPYPPQGMGAPYPPQPVPVAGYPPPPGMYAPQQPGMTVSYQTYPPTNETIIRSTQPQSQVVMVDGGSTCPKCRVGIIHEDFTLLGICCAVFLFPLGFICCLMMRQRRCSYCGTIYM